MPVAIADRVGVLQQLNHAQLDSFILCVALAPHTTLQGSRYRRKQIIAPARVRISLNHAEWGPPTVWRFRAACAQQESIGFTGGRIWLLASRLVSRHDADVCGGRKKFFFLCVIHLSAILFTLRKEVCQLPGICLNFFLSEKKENWIHCDTCSLFLRIYARNLVNFTTQ